MDIRGPRLRKPSDEALSFTSSLAFDGRIARQVVKVNMAHMAALFKAKEVDDSTAAKCLRFLVSASTEIPGGTKSEDFHQLLEQQAVDAIGVEAAGYLNLGKSRNDQVATAVRMEVRESIIRTVEAILNLQSSLLHLIRRKGRTILPGYTHLQRAQPVTLAHHLLAHSDTFQRDADRLLQLYHRVNLSPMGAAAMAGTSVKVDRRLVAEALGFEGIVRNAVDAVSSRDFAVEALSSVTMTMLDASRLAEELILWSSAEFGFVELDDAYSASSSIMPQKKNAVVAETVRSKSGSVLGSLVAVCTILKALPFSYNLDLQETTPHVWRAFDDTIASMGVLTGAISSLKINDETILRSITGDNSTAVALANYLVEVHGVSFREAHSIVGQLVRVSLAKGVPLYKVASSELGRVSRKNRRKLKIDEDTARLVLDPAHFLERIATEGGSNPKSISEEVKLRREELSKTKASLRSLTAFNSRSEGRLDRLVSELTREVKNGS